VTAVVSRAWGPIRPAGSWGEARTNDPNDVAAALALPGSWLMSKARRHVLVRRDQWANLGPGSGPPILSVADPGFGPVDGGTPVVLTGQRLTGTTFVFFGANQATTFNVVNDTTIDCTSPPNPAGLVNVNVIRGVASNAVQYEYRAGDAES
jgi:hypothetical protein